MHPITSLVLIQKVNAQRMFAHNFLSWAMSTHKHSLPEMNVTEKLRKRQKSQQQ